MPELLAIHHVPHERLGTFEPAFRDAGAGVRSFNIYEPAARWPSLDGVAGIVIMGGPMSVYEQRKYPFLKKEIALIEDALKREMPILGVCLGSQLLAAALGAEVTKNPQKEIGWYPIMREEAADGDPLFEPFGQTETVFQWHGDTFAIASKAAWLASSPLCPSQAFRFGENAYGLQFHIEVTPAMIRAWLRESGNRLELAALSGIIDPAAIKRQIAAHQDRLEELSYHVAGAFCRLLSRELGSSGRRSYASQANTAPQSKKK